METLDHVKRTQFHIDARSIVNFAVSLTVMRYSLLNFNREVDRRPKLWCFFRCSQALKFDPISTRRPLTGATENAGLENAAQRAQVK